MDAVLSKNTGIKFANKVKVSFDELKAILAREPCMMGGLGWVHWTGVRDVGTADILNLANPAGGEYMRITYCMRRGSGGVLGRLPVL